MQTSEARVLEQLQISVSAVNDAIKSPAIIGLLMFMMLRLVLAIYPVFP